MMVLLIVLICFGLSFLLSGLFSYYHIVSQNPCKVITTKTKFEKKEIKVKSSVSNIKLFTYPSLSSGKSKEKSNTLNAFPVLFVPGHNGRVDQVQYLASMQSSSNSRYQYFSIDASRGTSYLFGQDTTAIHASGIINQAVFLNDALSAIQKLYNNQGAYNVSITVVGHSVGGAIARTAVLLGNHPACVVGDMILLNSPIHSPPHSLDISNDALYAEVNKAWWSSLHNESRACVLSRFQSQQHHPSSSSSSSSSSSLSSPVTVDWRCPQCTANMRILSISSGDLDTWVHPSLASVDILSPRIGNNTARRVALNIKNSWSVQNIVKRFFYGAYHVIRLYVFGSSSPASTVDSNNISISSVVVDNINVSTNSAIDTTDSLEKVETNTGARVEPPVSKIVDQSDETINMPSKDNIITIDSSKKDKGSKVSPQVVDKYKSITMDDWLLDVDTYVDPMHLTIRTSQLLTVGFPVSHEDILSCQQVISVITKTLDKLTTDTDHTTNAGFTTDNLASIIGLELNYPQLDASSFIPPVTQILNRNHTSIMYKDSSRYDVEYFINSLTINFASILKGIFKSLDTMNVGRTVGFVRVSTYYFFSTQASAIAFSYYFLTVATLITPLMIGLLGGNAYIIAQKVLLLSDPSVHLFLGNIYSWLMNKFQQLFSSYIQKDKAKTQQGRVFTSIISLLVGLAAAGFHYYASMYPIKAINRLSSVLFPLAAYGVALCIRIVLLLCVYLFALIVKGIYSAGRVILRATIWCKPIRQFFRMTVARPVKKISSTYMSTNSVLGQLSALFLDHLFVLICIAITVGLSYNRLSFVSGSVLSLDLSIYTLSIGCVVSTIYVCTLYLCVLWRIPIDTQSATHMNPFHTHATLLLLYTPAILLSLPTFMYSRQLLFGHPWFYSHTQYVLKVLDPDRIHFCMALSVIALHLRKVLRQETQNTVLTIRPSKWLMEAMSASDSLLLAALDSYGDGSGAGSSGTCVHFDGGTHAIFEQIPPSSDVTTVARDVILGPTYRVVACACPVDKAFKSSAEWCEFCRCQTCNPHNRFKGVWDEHGVSGSSDSSGSNDFYLADLNPDLLVTLCLVSCLFVTKFYLYSTNNYLYALSLVAFSYLMRDYFTPILSRLHAAGQ